MDHEAIDKHNRVCRGCSSFHPSQVEIRFDQAVDLDRFDHIRVTVIEQPSVSQ